MDKDRVISAIFKPGDPRLGSFTVSIQPAAAVNAGIRWRWVDGQTYSSGTTISTWPGTYNITIEKVDGWAGPSEVIVLVNADQSQEIPVVLTPDTSPAFLTVPLSPLEAVSAGAKWRVNGLAYGNGTSVSLSPGTYTVTFDSVENWTKPPDQSITLARAETKTLLGDYKPSAGQPVIGGVSPLTSPLEGGILIRLTGANFTPSSAVTVGGKSASHIVVDNSQQITCLVPSGSALGSAEIVVQTSGGKASLPNLFRYSIPQGKNLDLVSSFGGGAIGLAVNQNHAFLGQGRSMLVLDISNPALPSKVGQVSLPGVVWDIAFFSQYVCVANGEGGLAIVDISDPANPAE